MKEKKITIETGDDAGKTFLVKRMPAVKGDRFMMRLFHGLAEKGFDIAESQRVLGALGMNQLTLNLIGTLDEKLFLELMDEVLTYVYIVPEGGEARPLEKEIDTKDMFTFSKLRMAFIEVHTGFLTTGENLS